MTQPKQLPGEEGLETIFLDDVVGVNTNDDFLGTVVEVRLPLLFLLSRVDDNFGVISSDESSKG